MGSTSFCVRVQKTPIIIVGNTCGSSNTKKILFNYIAVMAKFGDNTTKNATTVAGWMEMAVVICAKLKVGGLAR